MDQFKFSDSYARNLSFSLFSCFLFILAVLMGEISKYPQSMNFLNSIHQLAVFLRSINRFMF